MVVVAVSAMLVGVKLQLSPVGGEAATESDIVPANPWSPVVVINDVPVAPAKVVTLVAAEETEKSWTM